MPENKNDITSEELQFIDSKEVVINSGENQTNPEKVKRNEGEEENFVKPEPVYVVFVNEKPFFYTKQRSVAREKMIEFAKTIGLSYFNTYNYYINKTHDNTDIIQVFGSYRFFVISYDQLLATLHIHKVDEYINFFKED